MDPDFKNKAIAKDILAILFKIINMLFRQIHLN